MNSFEDSILRVMKGDSVVGAAFLVSDRLVATCAHVVQAAGADVGEQISLSLSNGKEIIAIVEPEFWRDANAEDISILRLSEPLENIQPVILGASSGTKGHSFSTLGFPNKGQELSGGGEIIGYASLHGMKLLQLDSRQVTPGFSGAPIFDEKTKRVVGMVAAITPPDEYLRQGTTAFAIPHEVLNQVCHEIRPVEIAPYLGLDTFTDETAEFYFGRENLTEKLLNVLRGGCRFLAVFGPSGSGKSSVVRAALLPALKKGQLPDSQKWAQITIERPADNPFEQMKVAGLDNIDANRYLKTNTKFERVVLFIDQFEELFTLCPDDVRDHFVGDLVTAIENSRLILILSMRDEFYSAFNSKATLLASSPNKQVVDVPAALERRELVEIIDRPAEAVGLALEEGLTERIVEDLTRDNKAPSSTLPLLEFALTQLWERRRDGMLTHDAYQDIDGVTGSLARWADDAYSDLQKADQALAEGLLTSLVHLGDEAQGFPDTRRSRPLSEFDEPTRRVIEYFADRRLLATSETRVDLIHDTLLREWGQLVRWLNENRNFLTWRQKLAERYEEWKKGRAELLRGRELAIAQDFWAQRSKDLVELGDYISQSERQSQQIERQARRTRLFFISTIALGSIMLGAVGIFAWSQSNKVLNVSSTNVAEVEARETAVANEETAAANAQSAILAQQAESTRAANANATADANATLASLSGEQASQQEILKISQQLSNDAKSQIDNDYRLGLLLGVESVRLNNLSLENALPSLLNKMTPGLIRTLDLSSGAVRKIVYAQNGVLMVSMSDTIDLWNTEDPWSPKPVESWKSSSITKPNDVVFSPNSKIMVIGYQDGHVELWDVSTVNIREINTPNDFSSQSLANIKVAISSNSQILAIAGNKRIKIWDISAPSSPQLIGNIDKAHGVQVRVDISYLGFAPSSTSPLLVSGGQDNLLSIWNLKNNNFNPDKRYGLARQYDPDIPDIAFSSKYLLVADKEKISIYSYSNNGLKFVDDQKYTSYHSGMVSNMVISPDNSRLYTTAQDGIIVEWNLEDPYNMEFIRKFDGLMDDISSVAFHPDAKKKLLVVGGDENDSTITIWNLHQQNISTMWYDQILNDVEITDIAYSPKLNLLAFGDYAGSIALRNVSNPLAVTKKPPRTIPGIPGPIRRIVFNTSENALLLLIDGAEGHYPSVHEWEIPLEYNDPRYLFQTSSADNFVAGNRYILVGEFSNGTTSIFNRDISKIPVLRDPKPISSNVCPFKSTASFPGGSLVAVAACKVQLWDFYNNNVPTMIKELEDSSDPRGMAFSTDGTLLASAHGNNSILIWGLASNSEYKLIHTIISAHTNGVTSVAISPDGKTMASGGGDHKVILWNISDPEHPTKIAELGLHTSPILNGGMFFLASGKTLISASKNEIILWNIDPKSWIEKACNFAGRNLTQSEWQRFVGPNIPYHNATCPELPIRVKSTHAHP